MKGKSQKKIYFVHQGLLSFVKKDLEILSQKHKIKAVNNFNSTLLKIPQNILGVLWCDLVFCWFGSLRFMVPLFFGRLLRKKIVIVAGGYDVVKLPDIDYGNMRGGLLSRFQKYLFKLAHCIICISQSNREEAVRNAGIPLNKIDLIYHGFYIPQKINKKKKNIVITVGKVNESNLKRKGHDFFIKLSEYFPDIPFFLIGSIDKKAKAALLERLPPNLTLTGYVSDDELEDYYSRAKIYIQASMHEGFGCSVAEAMLHECVPIVTDCFALPEVVGETGYFFKSGDMEGLKEKVYLALNNKDEKGKMARCRIATKFSFEARRQFVLKLIESIDNLE